MAVTISDSIYGAVPLPLDAKGSNIVPQGASTKVESVSEYLLRVDIYSRYLGMVVAMSYPNGTYTNSDFIQKVSDGEISITHYAFMSGIEDEDFLPWCPSCDPPIIQTRWTTVSSTCALDESGKRTGMVNVNEKEEKKVDDGPWTPTGQTRIVSSYNPILCPLPGSREVEIDRDCIVENENNNGYLKIIYNIEEQTQEGDWVVVAENQERIVYDAVACPIPPPPAPQYRFVYGDWTCIPDGSYNTGYKTRTVQREISLDEGETWAFDSNYPNETTYDDVFCAVTPYRAAMYVGLTYDGLLATPLTFSFGVSKKFNTPTAPSYNYLFLSLPTDRDFLVEDGSGTDIKDLFINTGVSDNVSGYRNNTIYRKNPKYASTKSLVFKLTIN